MDIRQVSAAVSNHARMICTELYPEGKVEGSTYKIGDKYGESGRSLSVYLSGSDSGRWCDFASGETGDLLDLIATVNNFSLKEAMAWAKTRFRLKESTHSKKIKTAEKKKYSTPSLPTRDNKILLDYLEKRGFKDAGELVHKYKMYEAVCAKGRDVVFVYYSPNGSIVNAKFRGIDYTNEGKSVYRQSANCKSILYGWQAISDMAREVWLTEGEFDCIACHALGFDALSCPQGGGTGDKHKWITNDWDHLSRFERILIATDMDEVGHQASQYIMDRLGDRCCRIELPTKDINELLQEKGYEQAKFILEKAREAAIYKDPPTLRSVIEFEEEIDNYFDSVGEDEAGFGFGWQKLDAEDIRFRPNEVWGVAGANGHGKSMWLGQVCLNAVEQKQKVLIASMEMTPVATMSRLLRQAGGTEEPSKNYRTALFNWLDQNLYLYVDNLTPKPDELLSTFEYAYRRYGINVFVIDSLTNMVRQDDYEGQQKFIEKLVQFKLNFPVTVFIVTHVRKGENEFTQPSKYDVKGSGAITDLADGFLSVWKNKKKLEHIQSCQFLCEEPDQDIVNQWDIYISVLKNRAGMFEGRAGFTFNDRCYQYSEIKTSKPKHYIEYSQDGR